MLRRCAQQLASESRPLRAALAGSWCSSVRSSSSVSSSASQQLSSNAGGPSSSEEDSRKAAVGRLLYRAKQRGFLEMDLLVGLWAQANLPAMDAAQLSAFEVVLDQENPDLFKWVTGQAEPPAALAANPAFADLRRHVAAQLEQHRSNAAMTRPGAEWVRGWDDWNQAPRAKT